jgi:hypothetical protein
MFLYHSSFIFQVFFYCRVGMKLSLLGTLADIGPIVSAPDDR